MEALENEEILEPISIFIDSIIDEYEDSFSFSDSTLAFSMQRSLVNLLQTLFQVYLNK